MSVHLEHAHQLQHLAGRAVPGRWLQELPERARDSCCAAVSQCAVQMGCTMGWLALQPCHLREQGTKQIVQEGEAARWAAVTAQQRLDEGWGCVV